MRIITGLAKGRIIKAPEGMITRPTSDRVKEALFNIIRNKVYDSNVLDLFAGSGNLGLEALSRGAKHCTFIESDKNAFRVLKENIYNLCFDDKSTTYFGDSFTILKSIRNQNMKYDLIFLDPPYGKGLVERSIGAIYELKIFSDNCLIVAELDQNDAIIENIGEFKNYRVEKYGRTLIALWNRED
ncbi:Ribosomal RNA small subunit methyltransferase D [Caloramator mitchellensis]|uniref:Ribosomal RNA small subunit methyltransferase D n=1 Tax=Caloramator mitchellensis TaxID=908809 RepID=A0A0R3JX56_CALMK|nr:16S rRNA (guanine(966)-N(2))-methyltransferase RsmD [Caloramator mitchellensis]KRQ86941.1 Ribosomal RNA small subunit methyltransferase D [Caloramator mitchellensis]